LSAGDAAASADLLVRWEGVVRGLNFRDPYHLLRGVLNEAEALVDVGRLAEAATALDWFVESARESDRDWPLTLAERPRALLTAAEGDLEGALTSLERLPDEAAFRTLPFERARAVLALGVARRRAKQRRAARQALESARDAFASVGGPLWEEKAAAELARVGGRAPAGTELTATEQRIAELVAGGKTNKEVAAELFVTVHTVEGALTRIYGKLDVRSRSQLAGKLAGKM